ncbi:hypothetical protein EDC19_2461 [Natranaerovirga hydrolytica]|uniref:Uncharacterized protein n=1 Tax=Natranaerovirga hydrolytica TaxID=680378 RepID=A0A4R1MAV9_9FIRM|nr:hypothetical protein [Natranaerovirga hydrolytica]TCK89047.1 hypothetical protein EDC19_2461 [Natranaerovirga hydrolytica]
MKHITTEELRTIVDREGLILQGCGGDPMEWINVINDLLKQEGILQNNDTFKEIYIFEYDNCTNILLDFENVDLDIGRLAMWRLRTHDAFGGTWLSDYLPNKLGVDMNQPPDQKEKPDCALIGQNSNIFNLMGIASQTLKKNGLREQAKEMKERITISGSYDEALGIIEEYVNITSTQDEQESNQEIGMEGMQLE